MAERKRTTKSETTKRENIKLNFDELVINRAHEFDNGNVSFDMTYQGIKLYRLTVIKTKDGDEFISFPSYESNGKWYNFIYMALSKEDQEKIIDMVYDSLDE